VAAILSRYSATSGDVGIVISRSAVVVENVGGAAVGIMFVYVAGN
jgi:hypothetical protein